MNRFISLVVILIGVAGVHLAFEGSLGQLLHLRPFLGVLGLTFLFCVKRLGFQHTMLAGKESFFGSAKGVNKSFDDFNSSVGSLSLLAANICSILGLIHLLIHSNQPEFMGIGVANAFTSYLYGCLLAAILPSKTSDSKQKVGWAELAIPIMGVFMCFFIVFYTIEHLPK